MKRLSYVVLILIAGPGSLWAQATTGTLAPLRSLSAVATKQVGVSVQLPVRCDSEHNIYLRLFHGRAADKEPLLKFSNGGEQKATYSLADDSAFQGPGKGVLDFSVARDGTVYLLAATAFENELVNYIVPFSKDGKELPKIQIGEKFKRDRFEVFDSGEFLITGTDLETELKPEPHAIYTAVFDVTGKLIRKIVLPEDASYEEAAKRGDIDFFDSGLAGGGNFAVERGMAARASDGNVYLMRWTVPAKVYAISQSGEVLRSFDVTSPLEGKKPASIHADGDRLAIQFEGDGNDARSLVKVVGLRGEQYGTYDTSGLGVAFACYVAPSQFTFLKGGDYLQLITYVPK